MRTLVISDLHGNWEGLEAALEAASGRYERIVCCGDLVGYGPDPNRVTDWVRANVKAVVRGNHDKACCGITDAAEFNALARAAVFWTRDQLTPENLTYLRNLPVGPMVLDGFQMVHGSVAHEDEYLFGPRDAADDFLLLSQRLTFFGHTHLQGGFIRYAGGPVRVVEPRFPRGTGAHSLELSDREQYLLNPGSVGQPRDGDSRAAFAIFSDEEALGVVEYWRAPYDILATQRKMLAAGLPDVLARRLSLGR